MKICLLICILVFAFTALCSGYAVEDLYGEKDVKVKMEEMGDDGGDVDETPTEELAIDEEQGDYGRGKIQEVDRDDDDDEETQEAKEMQLTVHSPWPAGRYSFPKPSAGCPFGFSTGCVYQDSENYRNANKFYSSSYLSGLFTTNIRTCYCTKTDTPGRIVWPRGRYCIARKGGFCPSGFRPGNLYWDDEDTRNDNSKYGELPDGFYGTNTRIYYCCRSDGSVTSPITLPTSHPFVLYRFGTYTCQAVQGMTSRKVNIYYDDEDYNNINSCSGAYPHNPGCSKKNHHVHMCYYS